MKVKELIQALQSLDPEGDICILDADTYWMLNITYVSDSDDKPPYQIAGYYGDEHREPE